MSDSKVPTFDQLMNPLLQALKTLGGSGTVEEIYARTAEQLRLPEALLAQPHDPEGGSRTEVDDTL